MPDPTLDPRTDESLDRRVRSARASLDDALGDVPAPAFDGIRARRDHRRMGAAAAAIAVVLVGSLAALATDDEGAVSTTDAPAPTSTEQPITTTTTGPPPPTSAAAMPTTTTTAPPTTSPPSTTTTTAGTQQPPEDPGARLRNKTFAGTTVTEAGEPRPLVEGTEITVSFRDDGADGDGIGWSGGCNGWGSTVVITRDRLDVGDEIGGTAMGCEQERHDQDDWLAKFFAADPFWTIDDGTLTLTVDDTVITLAERP